MPSRTRNFLTAICLITAGSVHADTRPAEKCYRETVKALATPHTAELTTRHCDRALNLGPHTAAHRAAMLHNRAIIERSNGDTQAALASLRRAVNLASEPGKPHLALAQLLHRIGEYRAAIELYQRLDAEHTEDSFIHQHRAAIAHNLAQAQQALAFELAER